MVGFYVSSRMTTAAGLLFAVLALTGCESTNENTGPNYLRLTHISPPADPYEEKTYPEDPGKQIWRPGYWEYNKGNFTWVNGTLMPRPNLSAVWSPDHWERREYGWTFVNGYWQ